MMMLSSIQSSRAGLRGRVRSDTVAALRAEVERLQIQLDSAVEDRDQQPSWRREATALLTRVRDVLEQQREDPLVVHEAWGWALDAKRRLVFGMDHMQIQAEAVALREEVTQKLHGWRKDAALELVAQVLAEEGTLSEQGLQATARVLERALRIRDEYTQNSYRDTIAVRRRAGILAVVVALATAVVLLASWAQDFPDIPVDVWPAPAFVLLFGFLGGSISAFRPLSRGGGRFPEQLARWYLTLSRPLIGGGAALALYPFVLAGLIPIELESFPTLAAASVAAGFSERPLSRAVAGLAGKTNDVWGPPLSIATGTHLSWHETGKDR